MYKKVVIGSLAFSAVLYSAFLITEEGAVLAYALIGLLISFIFSMVMLSSK